MDTRRCSSRYINSPTPTAVTLSAAVRKALAGFQPQMPAGVTLSNWYDQSTLVTESASSVRDAVLIGLALAGVVLFAFLRSLRVTLVAMLVVPATLAVTVLLLLALGMTFNIMTLGGIAAAVGLVIDDVITMVEHLARRADAGGGKDGVLRAGREFLPPLTGSSMATLLVFLPLVFLGGVTGAFFKALSLTMGAALIISYGLTALAVPVLARLIVNFDTWKDPGAGPEGRVGHAHRWLLGALFARPWLLVIGLVPLLALGLRRLQQCRQRIHAADGRGRLRAGLSLRARHIAGRDGARAGRSRGHPEIRA